MRKAERAAARAVGRRESRACEAETELLAQGGLHLLSAHEEALVIARTEAIEAAAAAER